MVNDGQNSTMDGRANNGDASRFGKSYLPTVWTKENNPRPEQKRGKYGGKTGRALIKAVLEAKFQNEEIKRQAAEYFEVDVDEITNELMIVFAQVGKAVNKQDTFAFDVLMTRAYGKPKDIIVEEDVDAPQIIVQPIQAQADTPPIGESEIENDTN
jgi:uncharacterized protein YneR